MYKEMKPADVSAREAGGRLTSDSADERPVIRTEPRTRGGDAAVQNELTEWKERCLRLAAEFDNFKKRSARDNDRRAAEQKHAFVRELLPVVDNLERALASSPAQSAGSLREGVELTLGHLIQVLHQHGFAGRDDLAQPFDPHYQEAIGVRCEPMQPDQTVLEVWQRGWLHGQALFRPAKVVVNDLKRDHHAEVEPSGPNEKGADHD